MSLPRADSFLAKLVTSLNRFAFRPPHKPLSEVTTIMAIFDGSLSVMYVGLYSG